MLLADVTGVQRSFWVLLGTLSVLRSNALNTGQNAARAIMGTVLGSVIDAALLQVIGHHCNVLWFLLPVAILIAGIAPAAVSFAAGQAAFTVTLVILFNIGQNPDWHIVLLRIQDIALGCAVSIVVALFFWPRGAAAALEAADSVTGWYRGLAESLGGRGPIPMPVELRPESAARLVDSVRTDLVGADGLATATAVRVIWTGDHVDVARRLQPSLAAAAKVAVLN